jgi:hypothetical protein
MRSSATARAPQCLSLIVLVLAALLSSNAAALAPRAQESAPPLPELPPRVWLGPDGEPLPLQTHDEVLDFLRTADVVNMDDIPSGITRPQKVLLEKDGIRMHAVFRNVDLEIKGERIGDRFWTVFWDEDLFEVAAYRLARMLGMDNVPPAVPRQIGRSEGSLQIWLEGVMTEGSRREEGLQSPLPREWFLQNRLMLVFDNLIWNTDRNLGNMLIDADWKFWLIDHTRAFQDSGDLRDPTEVTHVERVFWERLQALDEEQVRAQLGELIDGSALRSLLTRREKLIRHIEDLIAERSKDGEDGEAMVIFDWEY